MCVLLANIELNFPFPSNNNNNNWHNTQHTRCNIICVNGNKINWMTKTYSTKLLHNMSMYYLQFSSPSYHYYHLFHNITQKCDEKVWCVYVLTLIIIPKHRFHCFLCVCVVNSCNNPTNTYTHVYVRIYCNQYARCVWLVRGMIHILLYFV